MIDWPAVVDTIAAPRSVSVPTKANGDWYRYFEFKVNTLRRNFALTQHEAQQRALECCVVAWMNCRTPQSNAGHCAWCGLFPTPGCAVVPFGSKIHGHMWLHPECWQSWYRHQRNQASDALAAMGIHEFDE